jgi:hypothetical protein
MPSTASIQTISVIVPESPFVGPDLKNVRHCLAALDVQKLMDWWPGKPHQPHRDPKKVRDVQRSLDWKRVAQIAAYLLQEEIVEAPALLDECFREIYEPTALEPGREWPPHVSRVIGYQPSEYSLQAEASDALDNLLMTIAARGSKIILTFPNHSCSNGLSGNVVYKIALHHFDVVKKSVASRFSSLGGTSDNRGNEAGRAARRHTRELVLTLTPSANTI